MSGYLRDRADDVVSEVLESLAKDPAALERADLEPHALWLLGKRVKGFAGRERARGRREVATTALDQHPDASASADVTVLARDSARDRARELASPEVLRAAILKPTRDVCRLDDDDREGIAAMRMRGLEDAENPLVRWYAEEWPRKVADVASRKNLPATERMRLALDALHRQAELYAEHGVDPRARMHAFRVARRSEWDALQREQRNLVRGPRTARKTARLAEIEGRREELERCAAMKPEPEYIMETEGGAHVVSIRRRHVLECLSKGMRLLSREEVEEMGCGDEYVPFIVDVDELGK